MRQTQEARPRRGLSANGQCTGIEYRVGFKVSPARKMTTEATCSTEN
jgi:hypothetical protein